MSRLYHQVAERDGEVCAHCGKTPQEARETTRGGQGLCVDHVIAASNGGETSLANSQLLCMPCNSAKGNRAGVEKAVRFSSSVLQAGFTMVPNVVLLNSELSMAARFLYGVLTHYARQDDSCWPGQKRLAADIGLSERAIRDAVRELEARHLIGTKRRGKGQTNIYVIHMPRAAESAGQAEDRQELPLGPAPAAGLDRQQVPGKEDAVGSRQQEKKKDDLAVEEVFSHWLKLCDDHGKNLRSRELTPSRARQVKAGLKEATLEECNLALTGLFASEWHQSRGFHDLRYAFGWSPGDKRSLREKIDSLIDDAERAGAGRRPVPSESDGRMQRAKEAVRTQFAFAGNETAQQQGQRATEWLAQHGIEVIAPTTDGEVPTFRRVQ